MGGLLRSSLYPIQQAPGEQEDISSVLAHKVNGVMIDGLWGSYREAGEPP